MSTERETSRRAFTLIELLVVAAIIAILAVIAMVNYQESVTRARTSRAVADMRTVTVGLESYYVDHNDYPPNPSLPEVGIRRATGRRDGPRRGFNISPPELTTPVAYLSSIPRDPFRDGPRNVYDIYESASQDEKHYYNYYRIIPAAEWLAFAMRAESPRAISLIAVDGARPGEASPGAVPRYLNQGAFRKYGQWVQWASGPDGNLWNAVDDFIVPGDPLNALRAPIHPPWGYSFDVPYDPTNGTVSFGNIIRTQLGGQRPVMPDNRRWVGEGGPDGGPRPDDDPSSRRSRPSGPSKRPGPGGAAGVGGEGKPGSWESPGFGAPKNDFERLVEEKSSKQPYAHRPWYAFLFEIPLLTWLLLLLLLILLLLALASWLAARRRNLEERIALNSATITDADLIGMRGVKSLKRLHLAQSMITNDALRFLSDSTALEVLNLWGTGISDQGLAYLTKTASLRELILTDTGVTDEGMKFLARMSGLQSLVLSGLPITDAGVVWLRPMGGLKYLNIRSTLVSQEGYEALQKALPGCEIALAPAQPDAPPPAPPEGGNA